MRAVLVLLATVLALSACSGDQADQPPGSPATQARGECFWASRITGFSDAGPDKAILNLGQVDSWELTLSPGCPDVNWAMSLGIRQRGTQRICSGSDAELLIPNASETGFRRCTVRNLRRMSPEEAAAARGRTAKP